ncbi:uncharacterized protein LOC134539891 [Bacillus rossius redtenbacheri]|uniref:uncharacterized protein LOC134539891 n=1 Tax=Bacillus rossius redtenbacheri TaxID=93214 RepID=UPI002FDE944A
MTDLLSPKSKFWWTTAAEQALTAVKQRFRECYTLSRLDPDEPIFVQTDASQEGMGAVLYQEGGDGERRVAEYASAKFGPAERRYHANEQECLAGRKSKFTRWALMLQGFAFCVEHVPGRENQLADELSRHPDTRTPRAGRNSCHHLTHQPAAPRHPHQRPSTPSSGRTLPPSQTHQPPYSP